MFDLPRDFKISFWISVVAVLSIIIIVPLGFLVPAMGIMNGWRSISIPLLIVALILHLNVNKTALKEKQLRLYQQVKFAILGSFVITLSIMIFLFGFFLTWLN